jgi:hypothetical protein
VNPAPPHVQALLAEIGRLLPGAITPALRPSSKGDDLFEAFLFTLVVDAAQSIGAGIQYEDNAENPTTRLVLRTSPGRIYTPAPNYTHALLNFSSADPLEVHVGIFVAGKSTIAHECDVAIVERAEAHRARLQGVHPRSSRTLFTVEAKFYATALRIGLAREFTGLCSDLSAGMSTFATNTTAINVARLLSHRCPVGAYHPQLIPQSPAADDFRSTVRKVLERHIAQ